MIVNDRWIASYNLNLVIFIRTIIKNSSHTGKPVPGFNYITYEHQENAIHIFCG